MIGKYPRTKVLQEERRKRAEEVQRSSVSRSLQERLAKLDELQLVASKERQKIAKKMAEEAKAEKQQKKEKK